MMLKIANYRNFLLAALVSISFNKAVAADPTADLTVVVDGVTHKTGQICMRIYGSEKGFPADSSSEVRSGCTKITGSSVKKVFSGLKPGTYAVAVVDDQTGDHKLHRDFFGIPKDGFGISRNPIVSIQTGTPKFRNASFKMTKNTTINIVIKYSLDP
jgi:uncharacterized protein (DUF2141 family)